MNILELEEMSLQIEELGDDRLPVWEVQEIISDFYFTKHNKELEEQEVHNILKRLQKYYYEER